MFPPDVQTVYVPVFESDSFRRHLGERLTEAVIKEIERRTPYKVVDAPTADSVLAGRIRRDRKKLLLTNRNDEPRSNEFYLSIDVTWVDRRGEMIRSQALPLKPQVVELLESGRFVPEIGQSVATAQQDAIRALANQIVDLMETPW